MSRSLLFGSVSRAPCSLAAAGTLALLFCLLPSARGGIPSPEKLLPPDTLLLISCPDCAKFSESIRGLPEYLLWNDGAMRPFREKFTRRWQEEFVKPLERELGIHFENYSSLLQGQLTIALLPRQGDAVGLLVLLDSRTRSGQLSRDLADLRKSWLEAGKMLRTEKIRDVNFTVINLSSNDVPGTWRKFFPATSEVQEVGDDAEAPKPASKAQLVFGQFESLLIAGNSVETVEKLMVRLTGGSMPSLEDGAIYQQNHLALFRDTPLYAWANVRAFLDILTKTPPRDNPEVPNPFDPSPQKLVAALGLSALKTVAFSTRFSTEGLALQLFLGAPETSRQGILKVVAGEPKDCSPPPFIPAEALKFKRWRLDGKKTWAALEKVLSDISPQWLSSLNLLLNTAELAAREKDPGFDIRKNLVGNLGDDVITYELAPRDASSLRAGSAPSMFLLGSPNPEQFAAAFNSILVYFTQQAGAVPEIREFLGRKIYSVVLAPLPLPVGNSSRPTAGRSLHYAASGGYVAISSDVSLLEQYLRSSESQVKALRELPGLAEAAQRVMGPSVSLFGYENQAEAARAAFESLRNTASPAPKPVTATPAHLIPGGVPMSGARRNFTALMDFSLLPPFDKVARYFSFTVYGASATVDGLTFKLFAPTPPALRGSGTR